LDCFEIKLKRGCITFLHIVLLYIFEGPWGKGGKLSIFPKMRF
jgi:hypothetical protein